MFATDRHPKYQYSFKEITTHIPNSNCSVIKEKKVRFDVLLLYQDFTDVSKLLKAPFWSSITIPEAVRLKTVAYTYKALLSTLWKVPMYVIKSQHVSYDFDLSLLLPRRKIHSRHVSSTSIACKGLLCGVPASPPCCQKGHFCDDYKAMFANSICQTAATTATTGNNSGKMTSA